MKDFNEKVAVITGAASGIGKAISESCVKRNMKVVLVDIDKEALSQVEHELMQKTKQIISVVADVGRNDDIKKIKDKVLSRFQQVHVIFNNAGILGPIGPVWEADIQEVERVICTNLMGVFYSLKEFVPVMLKQDNDCYIINTASGAGLCTDSCMSAYMASKHALVALSEVLYFDLKEINSKINVSVVCPGLVESKIGDQFIKKPTHSEAVKRLIEFFTTSKKMPANLTAEKIFNAIEKNQFYIITHEDELVYVDKRLQNILTQKNPETC